jgi:hypothetical protein
MGPIKIRALILHCRIWGPRISGLANPHPNFVIASLGERASFPAETMPFILQIESARGSSVPGIPRTLDDAADQLHAPSLPFRYSVMGTK